MAEVYKTIVRAMRDTSTVASGTDATEYVRQSSMTSSSERGTLRLEVEGRDDDRRR